MGVTTKDLAEICGVSRTTVARALHGNGRISEETRQRILDTAKKLEYEPDLVARSLVSGRSGMIGVIIVQLDNQYYSAIVNAIAQRVLEDNYIVNITMHRDDKEMEKTLIRTLTGYRVDGLIISPINKGEAFQEMMKKVQVPYCVLGIDEFDDCPGVGIDEIAAGMEAAEYIVKKGYKKMVFLAPSMYDADGMINMGHHKRLEGIHSVMERYGASCLTISDMDRSRCMEKVLDFIRSCGGEKTAILCSGAIFALELMEYLLKYGYVTPDHYGLMTFDDTPEMANLYPRITCVNNHTTQIGYEAGSLLMKLIQGVQTEQRVVVPHSITERETL